jgi:hypothetical protein
MKSAIALLAALVGLAGLVALSCTAPLGGAPCPCVSGFWCDVPADICRPIEGDGSPFSPADASRDPADGSGSPFDADLDPTDSGGGSADASVSPADASDGFADADPFTPDADL